MSFLSRIFPFLFDEVATTASPSTKQIQTLPLKDKTRLIHSNMTPLPVLASLTRDKDENVQILLARRLAALVKKTNKNDRETTALLLEAVRQLTEESVTPVRIALVSALKDIAHCPPDLARKLADDVERAVAEPIIRYSLSLSDTDLIDLITRYPQDWQTTTIAQRKNVSSEISRAVIGTGNKQASLALLDNDGAIILNEMLQDISKDKSYAQALQRRNALSRKIKRDIFILAQRKLGDFLQHNAQLDKNTTRHVLDTVQRRIAIQDETAPIDPKTMSETAMKDALSVGNETLVVQAIATKAGTSEDIVRRMIIDSGAAKPVIAICTQAGLSMAFAVLVQQRMTRLPPTKILYPKNGTQNPLSAPDIQWQLEFFGIA